ncbi:MAG: hypothetical protein SGJ20_11660 [Planctomycetota bacterium]|nr:hypothetical protein [Planctomycetota bacterium]
MAAVQRSYVAVAVVFGVLAPPLMSGLGGIGAMFATLALLYMMVVFWLVAGNWAGPVRYLATLLFFGAVTLPTGAFLSYLEFYEQGVLAPLGVAMVFASILAVPLAIVRLLGFRLKNLSDTSTKTTRGLLGKFLYGSADGDSTENQLTLRSIFTWTVLAGIVMALCRSNELLNMSWDAIMEDWIFYGLIFTGFEVSLAAAIWAVFRTGPAYWSWLVPLLLVTAFAWGCLSYSTQVIDGMYMLIMVCMPIAMVGLLLIFNVFRQLGYRLVRVTRKKDIAPSAIVNSQEVEHVAGG